MLALLAIAAALASAPAKHLPAAAGAAAGLSPLDLYIAQEKAWEKANLNTSGWKLVTVGTDMLIFLRPAPRSSTGEPMVAIHGEHYPLAPTNSLGTGGSFLSRDEIDCTKKLARTVSSTIYSDNDLQGSIASASDDAGPWTAIKDGTFMAAAETSLCASPTVAH